VRSIVVLSATAGVLEAPEEKNRRRGDLKRHAIQLPLRHGGEVPLFGQLLPEQTVEISVAAIGSYGARGCRFAFPAAELLRRVRLTEDQKRRRPEVFSSDLAEDQEALLSHCVPTGDRSSESFWSSFLLIFCLSPVLRTNTSVP